MIEKLHWSSSWETSIGAVKKINEIIDWINSFDELGDVVKIKEAIRQLFNKSPESTSEAAYIPSEKDVSKDTLCKCGHFNYHHVAKGTSWCLHQCSCDKFEEAPKGCGRKNYNLYDREAKRTIVRTCGSFWTCRKCRRGK